MKENFNRFSDTFTKYLFANEERKHLTLSLVNSVFEHAGEQLLVDFEFYDREISPETELGKVSRLDILGKCSDGTTVNIEIQVEKLDSMQNRSLFYWAKLYDQLKSGEDYDKLTRTVCINILDHNYFELKDSSDFHNCFKTFNTKHPNHLLTDALEIHFIEMPKFEKARKKDKNFGGFLGDWLAYLSKKTSEKERKAVAMDNVDVAEAMKAESLFFSNPSLWWKYQQEEKAKRDAIAVRNTAIREGRAEGRAESDIENLKNLMESLNIDVEKAMTILKIPEDKRDRYLKILQS